MIAFRRGLKVMSTGFVLIAALAYFLTLGSGIALAANASFITKWGSFGSGDGQFNGLYGIEVDASGNVYGAEYDNSRIQKFGNTQAHSNSQVRTDGVTVSFSSVSDGGETSASVTAAPGGAPSNYSFSGDIYAINTDAVYSGDVTVTIPYSEGQVSGAESDVKIFRWNGSAWEDKTVSVDTEHRNRSG